jgi:hypothetical protein
VDEMWIAFVYSSLLGIGYRSNVQDQIDHAAAVTPFIVIPRHQLYEVVSKSNASLGIKNAGVAISDEVG